jgi:hypothetical protein
VAGRSLIMPTELDIIGSVPIKISLHGVIVPTFIGATTAVVGSVPMKVAVTGVITPATPGVKAVVGSVSLQVGPAGVINYVSPPVLLVMGSVGLIVRPNGIISEPVSIRACVGSVKLGIGVRGVVGGAFPIAPPVLAIIGSIGIGVNLPGVASGSVPSVLSVIGSVKIRIFEFRVPELTVVQLLSPADLILSAVTGSVGIEVGPTGVIALSTPPVHAVPPSLPIEDATIKIGVNGVIAFIYPQILEVIGDIEVMVGGGPVDPGIFETYVLTGARGEPSIYSGFDFNSYAKYRGQYFGAGEDGIYLLEGSDDAGAAIHSGIRIGPANLGTDREKRLRLLRCGGKSVGAQVKVSNGNGGAGYYDVENGRAAVSREVQGRELTIEIADFETLDHLEIVPLVLHKR